MNITFVRTRHKYDSYMDFWTLVELSGYPTMYVDELTLDNPDNVYIVCPMNGEYRPHVDNIGRGNIRSKAFLWNLERPDQGPQGVMEYKARNYQLISDGYVTGIIVSDRALAAATGFDYVPVGVHEGLGSPGSANEKRYDAIHLMCPSYRRSAWFDNNSTPKSVYQGLSIAPNGWGADRDARLRASRFMLGIHQDNNPFIEPLRYTLAAAYGLVIYADHSMDYYPYDLCGGIITCDMTYKELYEAKHNPMLIQWGDMFRANMLARFQFRQCVEEYLQP